MYIICTYMQILLQIHFLLNCVGIGLRSLYKVLWRLVKKMIHPQIRMRPILSLIWFTKIQRQQKTFGRYLCKTLFSLDFEQKLKKWTNLLGDKNGSIRIRKRPTSVQPIGTLKVWMQDKTRLKLGRYFIMSWISCTSSQLSVLLNKSFRKGSTYNTIDRKKFPLG